MKIVKDDPVLPVKKERACKRFYLVQLPARVQYKRLDSASFFSKEQGADTIREAHPDAKEIICLNRKAVKMMKLKEPKEYEKLTKTVKDN